MTTSTLTHTLPENKICAPRHTLPGYPDLLPTGTDYDPLVQPQTRQKFIADIPLLLQDRRFMENQYLKISNTPTLVLMAGLPGTGKTTIARKLSQELCWQVADKDELRKVLFSVLKEPIDTENSRSSRTAYELSFDLIRDTLTRNYMVGKDEWRKRLLESGLSYAQAYEATEKIFSIIKSTLPIKMHRSVIFDTAALSGFILRRVQDIISQAQEVRLKIILCVAGYELRKRRVETRNDPYTLIRENPTTIDEYYALFKRKLPMDDYITLKLNTDQPLDTCLDIIANHLRSK